MNTPVILLGGSMALVDFATSQQGKELRASVGPGMHGKLSDSDIATLHGSVLRFGGEILFVILLGFIADINDAAKKAIVVALVGLFGILIATKTTAFNNWSQKIGLNVPSGPHSTTHPQ